MPTTRYEVFALEPFPTVRAGDCLAELISARLDDTPPRDGDVVVIASKVVSIEEGQRIDLGTIQPSPPARQLADQTGKDPRVAELILRESRSYELATERGPIIAWHRLGYRLTSAGVDRDGAGGAYLLPTDPDASARRLRGQLADRCGVDVAVVISDSDGRPDRRGATVIAVGASGLAPLRVTSIGDGSRSKRQEETLVDLLAAAAGVVLGQRGRGAPVALIRGAHREAGDEGLRSILHH